MKASCRVSEELPWQLHQCKDKESLRKCLLNILVFQKMYARYVYSQYFGQYTSSNGFKMGWEEGLLEELPWVHGIYIRKCLLNILVFQKMYARLVLYVLIILSSNIILFVCRFNYVYIVFPFCLIWNVFFFTHKRNKNSIIHNLTV